MTVNIRQVSVTSFILPESGHNIIFSDSSKFKFSPSYIFQLL